MFVGTVAHHLKMDPAKGPPKAKPFGYNFSDDTLRPPSPHGEPILDPSDNNLLGNFFTDMQSDLSSGMGFSPDITYSDAWIYGVPGNLLGHTTSYGHQPQPDLAGTAIAGLPPAEHGDYFTFSQNTMPPPPLPARPSLGPSPVQQSRSQSQPTLYRFQQPHPQPPHNQRSFQAPIEQDPQVDAAALLTTLHAGHPGIYSSRTNSISNFHPPPHIQSPGNHRLSLPQTHLPHGRSGPNQPMESNGDHAFFTHMLYGSQEMTNQQAAASVPLDFGSDSLFANGQAFVPPRHESSEVLERRRMVAVGGALELNNSTSNTQPSSPIGNRETVTYPAPDSSSRPIKLEENGASTPSKRRKSKAKMGVEEDRESVAQPVSKAAAKKRKSKADMNGSSDSASVVPEASGKRRKSAPSQSKPPRENLTDAQKRENHIKSEQKRRGAIKEGFDDLTFIVPNLANGGHSKSSVLNIAGEWLEALIKGNEQLDREGKYAH
ncbi:hypothetical protein GGR51DRAFT_456598 [Nemania sp. FL0031]|nr:hypothetical protein GGR51DRAFT_456598 [Nemania sp. FL0031]